MCAARRRLPAKLVKQPLLMNISTPPTLRMIVVGIKSYACPVAEAVTDDREIC